MLQLFAAASGYHCSLAADDSSDCYCIVGGVHRTAASGYCTVVAAAGNCCNVAAAVGSVAAVGEAVCWGNSERWTGGWRVRDSPLHQSAAGTERDPRGCRLTEAIH